MSTFVGLPPFSNPLWVAMETMHFHIPQTSFFRKPSFRIQGVPMNDLVPVKNWPWGRKVTLIGSLNITLNGTIYFDQILHTHTFFKLAEKVTKKIKNI